MTSHQEQWGAFQSKSQMVSSSLILLPFVWWNYSGLWHLSLFSALQLSFIQALSHKKFRGTMALLNTPVTMHWFDPRDCHVEVIKLPSSIMNNTIIATSGLLLWDHWIEEKMAGAAALCLRGSAVCGNDYDYSEDRLLPHGAWGDLNRFTGSQSLTMQSFTWVHVGIR